MRRIRLAVAAVLGLSVAVVAPAAATALTVLTPSYTVFAGSGSPTGSPAPGAFLLDPANSTLHVSSSAPDQIAFGGNPGETVDSATTILAVITGANDIHLAAGHAYKTSRMGDPGTISMDIVNGSSGCNQSSGTLSVDQLSTDLVSGDITAFAAEYTYRCDTAPAISGVFRWNSDRGYAASQAAPANWDFGSQPVKTSGAAKAVLVENRGTGAVKYGAASFTGSVKAMSVSRNTCSGKTVAAGGNCMITVIPHPQAAASGQSPVTTATLHVVVPGRAAVLVAMQVEGRDYYPIDAKPGPARITFAWDQLPGPFNAAYNVSSFYLYRGVSSTRLTYLRKVSGEKLSFNDTGIKTGTTYYYAVRPHYADGTTGDASPVVAARAWPKYTAGMYHKLSSTVRFTSGHRVVAGRAYSLKILGQHGIPGSGVSAIALDLEASGGSSATSVSVYPAGSKRPAAADLTVARGAAGANFVLAKVGSGGRVVVSTTHGTTPVTIDVEGYFSNAGLGAKRGTGGAFQADTYPATLADTKAQKKLGPLPAGYYLNTPVTFNPAVISHVTSLVMEVTAYGSTGSGTITGFASNNEGAPHIPDTTMLAYSPGHYSSNIAIIPAGKFLGGDGVTYPSASFLNRGKHSVQLFVTILGYFDDDTLLYGQRYTPTAPVHLFSRTMHSGGTTGYKLGAHGGVWTEAMNSRIVATNPSATTSIGIKAVGGGPAPTHGQLHATARSTSVASTLAATGVDNAYSLHNSAGTVKIDIWSFGRFDAYPVPVARGYASLDLSTAPPDPGVSAASSAATIPTIRSASR